MKLYFRIKLKEDNKEIQVIDYELSELEIGNLIKDVGTEFLSIPDSNNDLIRFELDVIFESLEMVYKIITVLTDMFPHSLKAFQNMTKNKRKKKENLVKLFVQDMCCSLVQYENTISFEFDKFFMMYYIIVAKRDTSNINRNITNKLNKIGINTINFVPFVRKLELTDIQFSKIKKNAINTDESEEEQNLFILDSDSLDMQKLTENDTHYYIYLYRKRSVSIKNCTHEYYYISNTIEPKQRGFNMVVAFPEEQETIKLSDIYSRCKLFNDLCNSTKVLPYKEIVGIITNLHNTNIRTSDSNVSSIKYILDHIDEQQRENWKLSSIFIKANNYQPQKCREFCPYSSFCTHTKTMLRTVHIKKDTIEKIDRDEQYVTVEESRKELNEVMNSSYSNLLNNKTDLELIIAPPRSWKNRKNN